MTTVLIDRDKHEIYCDTKWSTTSGHFGLDAQKMFVFSDLGVTLVGCGDKRVVEQAAIVLAKMDQIAIRRKVYNTALFVLLLRKRIESELPSWFYGSINTNLAICFYKRRDGRGRMPVIEVDLRRNNTTVFEDIFCLKRKLNITVENNNSSDYQYLSMGSGAKFVREVLTRDSTIPVSAMLSAFNKDHEHTGGDLIRLSHYLNNKKPSWFDGWLYDYL